MSGGRSGQLIVAIVGNPNSGKTTVFNGLTGGKQRIGNWPGVTVERKEGSFTPRKVEKLLVEPFATGAGKTTGATTSAVLPEDAAIRVVDLPGIYSLSVGSQDEEIARDYLLSGEPDLVVNVVDASNIQRNLFLTLQLIEMQIPVLVVLNMMDVAEAEGISINVEHLAEHLQCPVVPVVGIRKGDVEHVKNAIATITRDADARAAAVSRVHITYPPPVEEAVARILSGAERLSVQLGVDARWIAVTLLDGDPWIRRRFLDASEMGGEELDALIRGVEQALGEEIDVALVDARYGFIHGLSRHVSRKRLNRETLTERVDRVVMNRILALPIFFGIMYLVFWFTLFVGGAFIDFFDILFGTIFVDGLGAGLSGIGAPEWLVALLAGGIGSGIQTVATFIPIIFAMFVALALLEDSGYMSRAAYVMDRFMRGIGLPGRSFVPMMVGFGCTVPAIMATRTLDTPRDRFMTIFMAPFMSCGARLPVYALFAAAFFSRHAGLVVFSLYVVGIVVAIATGFLLKHTLFRGEVSHFVMELPPYHAPRIRFVLAEAGRRLWTFIRRAGITIIVIVTVLSFMNTIGTDGTLGHEDQADSVLATVGRAITPVFAPMGIRTDNWPATVGLFTGIFAKEVIVGTLSSLYGQADVSNGNEFNFGAGVQDALRSVPEAFAGAVEGAGDPLGTGIVSSDAQSGAPEAATGRGMFTRMRAQFSPAGAYAYLLFVLLYIPCVAAVAAAAREMGVRLAAILVGYTSVVAWSLATLFYQLSTGPRTGPVLISLGLLAAVWLLLSTLGHTVYRPARFEGGDT